MPRPVVFFEIAAQNLQREREFYTQLFDWTIAPGATADFVELGTGPGGIDGAISQPGDAPSSSLTVYVDVDDIDAYLQRAEALGGSVIFPAMDLPDGNRIAMIADPEGVMIGLVKRKGEE
jgi:uncharacterized protein